MKTYIGIACLVILCFCGCATKKISKAAYHESIYSLDFYEQSKSKQSPGLKTPLITCFNIAEAELKQVINSLALECYDKELKNAPEIIDMGSSEFRVMQTSVEICLHMKFYSKYKDDFTFDKSAEDLERCRKIYDILRRVK